MSSPRGRTRRFGRCRTETARAQDIGMRKVFLVAAGLALPLVAHAKDAPQCDCSIKAKHANAAARNQAKVGYDQAKSTALGAVQGESKQVRGGGLEADHGCLVYRYDV